MEEDLDSTQALLDSTIPTPTIVDSYAQDSEEEEIFFGNVSEKEKIKSTKFKRYVIFCSVKFQTFHVEKKVNWSFQNFKVRITFLLFFTLF